MRIEAVVAINRRRVLGDRGTLPWHAPRDLRHFRELTTGSIMVMGRKTYDAIGRVLPDRENVVVTRQPERLAGVSGLVAFSSFEAVLAHYGPDEPRVVQVIGGAQLFEVALPYVQTVHLTVVDDDQPGDVVLPGFEHLFVERAVEVVEAPGNPRLVFKTLDRLLPT